MKPLNDSPPNVAAAGLLGVLLLAAPAIADGEKKPPSLLGEVTREQLQEAEPSWVAAQVECEIDEEAALALGTVPEGAVVTIYLGTWCGDSKRELARFFRALDTAGSVGFEWHLIAVDRLAQRPPEMLSELGLRWVPTFIVKRDGVEVGRVVESSLNGLEKDLLALLDGSATGVLTAREDGAALEPPAEAGAAAEVAAEPKAEPGAEADGG